MLSNDMARLMGEADLAAEQHLIACDEALSEFQQWADQWARRRFPAFFSESPTRRRQLVGKHLAQEVWELSQAVGAEEVSDEAGDVLMLLARYCSEHGINLAEVLRGVRTKLTARLREFEGNL